MNSLAKVKAQMATDQAVADAVIEAMRQRPGAWTGTLIRELLNRRGYRVVKQP